MDKKCFTKKYTLLKKCLIIIINNILNLKFTLPDQKPKLCKFDFLKLLN
jgi:hypothetical protein